MSVMIIKLESGYILVVVCLLFAHVADCCNRSPSRSVAPPPKPQVTAAPPPVNPATAQPPSSGGGSNSGANSNSGDSSSSGPGQISTAAPPSRNHRLTCTGPEIQTTACLNKGTCFAVIIENTRQSFCRCPEKYSGRRCQDAQLPPGIFFSMENVQTANIAFGVAVAVIIIVVLLLSTYVYVRWRKKTRLSQTTIELSSSQSDDGSTHPTNSPVHLNNTITTTNNSISSHTRRSSHHSLHSQHSQSKINIKDGFDPGGEQNPPCVNGAGYYTMQETTAWSPTRSPDNSWSPRLSPDGDPIFSPWTYHSRSSGSTRTGAAPSGSSSGSQQQQQQPLQPQQNLRHSHTLDNVLNSNYRDRDYRSSNQRTPSETTV